ncbi:MAG TPA: DUF885 family protein, partial [Myxococcales bacterium]
MRTTYLALLALAVSCSHSQKPASAETTSQPSASSSQAAASSSQTASSSPQASGSASAAAPSGQDRAWIERSNQNAKIVLDVQARFAPEFAARQGVTGVDDQISDFKPGHHERQRAAIQAALSQLEQKKTAENDPLVRQDLEILVDAAKRQIEGSELHERLQVPYYNLPRLVFSSTRALLDKQVSPDRYPAALVRVRKYAGQDGGPSIVQLAEAETRAGLSKGLLAPSRIEVENDLETAKPILDGIQKLFVEFKVQGSEEPVAALRKQLEDYLSFVRQEVLPKARSDFRLPPELYAFNLRQVGVDIPPQELVARAKRSFNEYLGEMKTVAARIAEKRHLPSSDYKDVIHELKKNQIPDDQVLAFYEHRLGEIEDIIRREHLVTLPSRPAQIRLGTPAENAQQPAPHMEPPRLIGNTGQRGTFVLPLSVPGKKVQKYDDFNYDAAAWTLTAHEARPGHELQFSRMV